MAGNNESIDHIIDQKANKEVADLLAQLELLEKQFIDTAKGAISLNNATGGSRSFREYNQNSERAALATQRLQQAQNNTAKSAIQLQAAQDRLTASQTRTTAAAQRALSPYEQLNKQHVALRNNARDLGVQFGENSEQFKMAAAEANKLDTRLKTIDGTLGQSQRNVGNYAGAFSGLSKAFGVMRTIAYVLPGLGIAGEFQIIGDAIVYVVEKLELFNSVIYKLSKVDIKNLAFKEAFEGGDFKKGIESVQQLAINLELAKDKVIDQSKVIDEYNDTIGTVTGRVDNFTDAQKGFVDNSDKYIAAILNEAAAQSILAASAKDFAEVGEANNKLRQTIIANNKIVDAERKGHAPGNGAEFADATQYGTAATLAEDMNRRAQTNKAIEKQIDKNTQSLADRYKNRAAVLKETADNIAKVTGAGVGQSGGGISKIDALLNELGNQDLDREKSKQAAIIQNEKLSYNVRLKAVSDYATAEKSIAERNRDLALKDNKASQAELLQITKAYANAVSDAEEEAAKKSQELKDKRAKEIIEGRKKDLDAQKQAAKLVIDSPGSSLDQKLTALEDYKTKSTAIITLTDKEQVKDAGDVAETIRNIHKDTKASILSLDIDYAAQTNKILESEYNKQIEGAKKHDDKLLDTLKTNVAARITEINNGRKDETDKLNKQLESGAISEAVYNAKRTQIDAKANDDIVQAQIDGLKHIVDLKRQAGMDIAADSKTIADLEVKQAEDLEKRKTDAVKTGAQARASLINAEYGLAHDVLNATKSIVDGIFQSQTDKIADLQKAIDQQTKDEKDAVDRSIDTQANKQRKQAIIDAQATTQKEALAKKEGQIQQEAAKFNKLVSLLNIGVATAEAVGKIELQAAVLAANPLTLAYVPVALAQIPIAIAAGAIQAAAVLATPLPHYEKGGTTKGGGLIWGERGTELAIEPGGKTYLSPDHATYTTMPAGTKIIPNNELTKPMRMNKVSNSTYSPDVVAAINNNTAAVTRALDRQKSPKVSVSVDGAWYDYSKRISR